MDAAAQALVLLLFSLVVCYVIDSVGRVAFDHGRGGGSASKADVLKASSWKTKHGSAVYYQELRATMNEYNDALRHQRLRQEQQQQSQQQQSQSQQSQHNAQSDSVLLTVEARVERAAKYVESLGSRSLDITKRVARELYADRTGVQWPLRVYELYSSKAYSTTMHTCCLVLICLVVVEPPNVETACARPDFYVGVAECNTSLVWAAAARGDVPQWLVVTLADIALNLLLTFDVVLRGVTYGFGRWAPIKDTKGNYTPERRDVTVMRLVLQVCCGVVWCGVVV